MDHHTEKVLYDLLQFDYKNFSEKPIISISKKKLKKNNNFFLEQGLNKFTLNDKLENLSIFVKRLNFKIVIK